ncbi:MAG: hypothetical protein K0V04_36595 [Deltaproteobacteria bacterium]|nr:hypothetical protein [Deltaproteobacteria bacterium]
MRVDRLISARARTIAPAAALLLLAVGGEDSVPWPDGDPPADAEIAAQIDDAIGLFELERAEEYLEALEKGEDAEHFFVLQEDIDEGFWSLDQLFIRGDALFGHEFRADDGFGDEDVPVAMQRVHQGRRGGRDAFSCAACHSLGGADGAGSGPQNAHLRGDGSKLSSTVVRNPPAAIGLGFVQALAREMTLELQLLRDDAVAQAQQSDQSVVVALQTKEVDFGTLTVAPDGSLDTSEVRGIDADLVVKPFGWKGNVATLRRSIEDAALVHFGIQSHVLALGHQQQPDPERLGTGPDWFDPDGDGHARELEEGTLTATAVYLAMLEAPQIIPPHDPGLRDRWAHGSALFDVVGCAQCHVRQLPLLSPIWRERSDTTNAEPVVINLLTDGEHPKAGARVQLFSDLRRHDMGPELSDDHEQPADAIAPATFLTRPLWGLAESPPYLHDGRATTIVEAIIAHGGEAEASRDAFVTLPPEDQADLHVFLLSLSRAPRLRVPL